MLQTPLVLKELARKIFTSNTPSNDNLDDFDLSYGGKERTEYIYISPNSSRYRAQVHISGQCEISGIRVKHNDPRNAQIKKLALDLLQKKGAPIPDGFEFLNQYADEERFTFTRQNLVIEPIPPKAA